MPRGLLSLVGVMYSEMTPAVVIRPILLVLPSANHSAPSGPTVISLPPMLAVGVGYSEMAPAVVIRPILLLLREPQRAVRTRGDAGGVAVRGSNEVFGGDEPRGRDPSDLVAKKLREPQCAVRGAGDSWRPEPGGGEVGRENDGYCHGADGSASS
jgi:hypothetical protein